MTVAKGRDAGDTGAMTDAPPAADRLRMDAAALNAFLRQAFPHAERPDGVLLAVPGHVRVQLVPDETQLRPGGIVSGPTLMGLADRAAYALVLAHIGPVAMAVTSSLTYHFLRACPFAPVHADARLLRLGRRLVVMDVRLWSDDEAAPVGQASVTYAVPA